jgi:DNA-binding MarR family transcriptional regulator
MGILELQRCMGLFGVFDPQMPLHFMQIFLHVAQGPPEGLLYRQLEEAMNLTNSSVSRTLDALGDEHRRGYRGYGLIERKPDPQDPRRLRVFLSARGKALANQITNRTTQS